MLQKEWIWVLYSAVSTHNIAVWFCSNYIDPPNFDSGSGIAEPPLNLIVISLRYGQNYEAKNFATTLLIQIFCPEFNGTDTTLTAYKNGVEIDGFSGTIRFGPVPPPSDDVFGTYTFATENNCGRDIAVTRIIRKGQCNCWCIYVY